MLFENPVSLDIHQGA